MTTLPPSLPPHLEDQTPNWLSKSTSAQVLGNPIVWSVVTALFILLGYLWLQYYARPLSERLAETRTDDQLIGAQDRKEWNPDIYRDVKTLDLMPITRQADDLRAENYRTTVDHENKIQPLLKKARALLELGQYVGNNGDNAWQAYQSILDIEPDNKIARSGVAQVLSAMQGEAEYATAEKQYADAERWLTQLDFIDREGQFQAEMRQKIDNQINEDLLLEQEAQRLAETQKLLKSALQDASTAMQSQPPEFIIAYDLYRRVLELDNDNKTALAGLREILKQRAQLARLAISRGEYELAATQIERIQQTGGAESTISELITAMRAAKLQDQLNKVNNARVAVPAASSLVANDTLPAEGSLPTAEGALSTKGALLAEDASSDAKTLPVKGSSVSEGTSAAQSASPTEHSNPAEAISPLETSLSEGASDASGADRLSEPDINERAKKLDGSLKSWENFLNQPGAISPGDRRTADIEETQPSTNGSFQNWKNFFNTPGSESTGERTTAGIEETEPNTDGSLQSWQNFLTPPGGTATENRKTTEGGDARSPSTRPATTPPSDPAAATRQPAVPITTIPLPDTTATSPASPASSVGVDSVKIQPARPPLGIGTGSVNEQSTTADSSVNLAKGILAYYSGDYQNAFYILHPLAEKNQPRAQFRIGMMYYQGQSVAQNLDIARQWCARAMPNVLRLAQKGEAWAQADLGTAYELGVGVVKDPQRAARLYQQSARQNYPGAQANLGLLYAKGEGLKYDRQAAIYWLKHAAAQGDFTAKMKLKALNSL